MTFPNSLLLLVVAFYLSLLPGQCGEENIPLSDQAVQALMNRHYAQAIELSTVAIKLNPNDAEAYFCRACSLTRIERREKAVHDFDKGFSLTSKAPPYVYLDAAKCYTTIDQDDKALNAYNYCLKLDPSAIAYREKAQLLWKMNRPDESLQTFAKALKLAPNEYWIYQDRVDCLVKLKRYDDALKDANKLVELRPKESRSYATRAKIYEKLNKGDLVKADLKKANDLGLNEWF